VGKIKVVATDNFYGPLAAEFYQLTKPVDEIYPDTAYYLDYLSTYSKSDKILELACGTGRLLVPLLRHGIQIEGCDINPYMLDFCKKNLQSRKLKTHIYLDDAKDLKKTSGNCSAIVISFGSFQLFSSEKDALKVLKACHLKLKKGGRLFVDLDLPKLELERSGLKVAGAKVEVSAQEFILIEGAKKYSITEQIESVQLRYEKWKKQKLMDTELQFFDLRWYHQNEFKYLLEDAGFKIENFCVDFDDEQKKAHDHNEVMSFVALKT
jgi:SAM-dependent methyltransferase